MNHSYMKLRCDLGNKNSSCREVIFSPLKLTEKSVEHNHTQKLVLVNEEKVLIRERDLNCGKAYSIIEFVRI